MASDLLRMFFGGVTQHLRDLPIYVGVLRDVIVLPTGPPSLSYELAGDSVTSMPASQTCWPPLVRRPRRHAAFHAIRAVVPRFVHKSVHKPSLSCVSRFSRGVPEISCRTARLTASRRVGNRHCGEFCARLGA
jgi:hypothetical protein